MTHPPIDDKPTLLTLARNGDLAAFSSLIEAEQSRLMAQAQAFCADPHLAEDLVQETMIAAWKGSPGVSDAAKNDFGPACAASRDCPVALLR